ncbi:PREDICTED: ATP synthase subunit O, mitochondrial-like [Rhagoletis zephyria]|uniref:ATP synthase subunit O, mitochondrial-like n=1 Tax=Rhagoletis zephyria TaxID=28612 RepID=UPI00081184DB|nr:PREDICTED: ATP synthase subunit O, mitochondrial-like [Rhagoletis zephyria]
MVKPPVPMFGVDGRYASALYSAASKKNKLEAVDKNLKTLLELQQKDEKFRDFLINPLIKAPQKREILGKSLASKLNLDELTLNLIAVLSENGRMKLFPAVARAFNKTMAVSRGEINVNVTASSALDAESQKELNDVLQAFAKGKKLIVSTKVDKSILGGLIIDFDGEHYVDMSIRKKFNQFSNLLRQPV